MQATEITLFKLALGNLLEDSFSPTELVEEWQNTKEIGKTSAYNQDEATGTKFTLPPEMLTKQ